MLPVLSFLLFFFFFNDTATTEIYTLSLHDALPISPLRHWPIQQSGRCRFCHRTRCRSGPAAAKTDQLAGRSVALSLRERKDRKSTRLNSSHSQISYAVFCLKKKKKIKHKTIESHRN